MANTHLSIRRVPLSDLHLDPSNARAHGDVNMDAIRASLSRFGQAEPLVVQSGTGRVIGGNGRLAAMRQMGWTECDVVEVDLDDLQATALGIALNRTAELADWDTQVLSRLLGELKDLESLDGVGFSEDDVDSLLAELDEGLVEELEDPGTQEPPEQPVTQRGDLWILGDHRILCGDSTSREDMARLMDGQVAHLLATDPPYLVDYDGTNHPAEHHKQAGREKTVTGNEIGNKHWDAYIDPESSVSFFSGFLKTCLPHTVDGVPIYQWHATRRQGLVEQAWEELGLLVHQTIVWAKSRGVLTRSHFLWKHEPCFYGWVKGNMPPKDRRPPPSETTIWEIDQAGENDGIHPTQKPRDIFRWPIEWHTRRGEVVLEPFSGSGTQIIAAEELGRRCFAMELSPGFVDAAVVRWERSTGKEAVLDDGTGRTFGQVSSDRETA